MAIRICFPFIPKQVILNYEKFEVVIIVYHQSISWSFSSYLGWATTNQVYYMYWDNTIPGSGCEASGIEIKQFPNLIVKHPEK